MKKQIFIDVETTGTDERIHDVVQISGMIMIDDRPEEVFDYDVRPFPINEEHIDEHALRVIGKKKSEILEYPDPLDVHLEFTDMLSRYVDRFDRYDKFAFIGYNATFDDQFLRAFFRRCGDGYYGSYFWWPPIDVAVLVMDAMSAERGSFPSFKLIDVCNRLGIESSGMDFHDAMTDIIITREIYKKITRGDK